MIRCLCFTVLYMLAKNPSSRHFGFFNSLHISFDFVPLFSSNSTGKMEEDVNLCCNSHPQAQAPDDPLHDQGSQYASCESLYLVPFGRRVPRPSTNQHFHSLLLQFLSQGNEHLLSGKGIRTHLFESNNWFPIFPSSFSVHPCQERPWANTDGSQGFSRLICWGYVQLLLIQGYVPGWIRFVRQDLVSVHTT